MTDKRYIPGQGAIGAKFIILSDAPSHEDVNSGRPLSGSAGRETDRLLRDAGINRGDCWVTTVSKYEVPPNLGRKKLPFHVRARDSGIDMDQQLEEL